MKKKFLAVIIFISGYSFLSFIPQGRFPFLDLRSYYLPGTKKLNEKIMRHNSNDLRIFGRDSIYFDLHTTTIKDFPYNPFHQHIYEGMSYQKKIYKSDVEIFVDTLNTVSIEDMDYSLRNFSYEDLEFSLKRTSAIETDSTLNALKQQELDSFYLSKIQYVEGIPVYIMNFTDSTTSVDREASPSIIQEAKNKNGEWMPIEYTTHGFCGNGYSEFVLEPDYFLVTFVYKYYGDFETELRIKLRNNNKIFYSKPFRGSINLSQFAIPDEILKDSLSLFFRPDFLHK